MLRFARLRFVLSIVLGFGTLSCGKTTLRQREEAKTVATLNDNTLLELNATQNEITSAISAAFPGRAFEGSFSVPPQNKVEDMRKALVEGSPRPCDPSVGASLHGPDDFSKDFQSEFKVDDSSIGHCPIALNYFWSYVKTTGAWTWHRRFDVRSSEFRKLSALRAFEANGTLHAHAVEGGMRVFGRIHYSRFQIDGLGNVGIEIVTEQKYAGREGGGSATAIVTVSGVASSGTLRWDTQHAEPDHLINGNLVDDKTFSERFSAYGLTEIMDRSLKLR